MYHEEAPLDLFSPDDFEDLPGGPQDIEPEPMPLNIPELLGEYLQRIRKGWDKNGRIYASDVGIALGPEHAGCTLAFWLKCKNEPRKEKGPGELLLLQQGDNVHEVIQAMVAEAVKGTGWTVVGNEEKCEVHVDGERVGGRLDIRLQHDDGRVHIIDIKTKRGQAFRFLPEAKPGDVLQVQLYMKATDADSGSVLYVDREGQNFMREFDVERNDVRPETAVRKLVAIRDNPTPPAPVTLKLERKENKGPDSLYLKVPWQIGWCDLQQCACRKALPIKGTPDGIIAKLKTNQTRRSKKNPEPEYINTEVRWTDVADDPKLQAFVLDLLETTYPNETFVQETT
jgi:hypothetical protein